MNSIFILAYLVSLQRWNARDHKHQGRSTEQPLYIPTSDNPGAYIKNNESELWSGCLLNNNMSLLKQDRYRAEVHVQNFATEELTGCQKVPQICHFSQKVWGQNRWLQSLLWELTTGTSACIHPDEDYLTQLMLENKLCNYIKRFLTFFLWLKWLCHRFATDWLGMCHDKLIGTAIRPHTCCLMGLDSMKNAVRFRHMAVRKAIIDSW